MNQIIINVMIVYVVASIVYLIYIKLLNSGTLEKELTNNQELLEKYKKIKRNRTMAFIIGIILGLIFLIFIDNEIKEIPDTLNIIVTDISDIQVI